MRQLCYCTVNPLPLFSIQPCILHMRIVHLRNHCPPFHPVLTLLCYCPHCVPLSSIPHCTLLYYYLPLYRYVRCSTTVKIQLHPVWLCPSTHLDLFCITIPPVYYCPPDVTLSSFLPRNLLNYCAPCTTVSFSSCFTLYYCPPRTTIYLVPLSSFFTLLSSVLLPTLYNCPPNQCCGTMPF